MTEFENQMLAKMDALLAEMRMIRKLVERPALKVVQGGRASPVWPELHPGLRR